MLLLVEDHIFIVLILNVTGPVVLNISQCENVWFIQDTV